jgi:hypothetical protein
VLRIRDPGSVGFLRPRSGPDPGSGSPNPYFRELKKIFGGKKYLKFSIDSKSVLYLFKTNINFSFVKFMVTEKGKTKLCCWIRDSGWEKSGSGINIPADSEHCITAIKKLLFCLFSQKITKGFMKFQLFFNQTVEA